MCFYYIHMYTHVSPQLEESEACLSKIAEDFGRIRLLYGVRFLIRPLFPLLQKFLEPGAMIAWSHFTLEEDGSWGYPHPKTTKFILEFNELESLFGEKDGFEILVNKHIRDTDHGRPLQIFIARKKVIELLPCV